MFYLWKKTAKTRASSTTRIAESKARALAIGIHVIMCDPCLTRFKMVFGAAVSAESHYTGTETDKVKRKLSRRSKVANYDQTGESIALALEGLKRSPFLEQAQLRRAGKMRVYRALLCNINSIFHDFSNL